MRQYPSRLEPNADTRRKAPDYSGRRPSRQRAHGLKSEEKPARNMAAGAATLGGERAPTDLLASLIAWLIVRPACRTRGRTGDLRAFPQDNWGALSVLHFAKRKLPPDGQRTLCR